MTLISIANYESSRCVLFSVIFGCESGHINKKSTRMLYFYAEFIVLTATFSFYPMLPPMLNIQVATFLENVVNSTEMKSRRYCTLPFIVFIALSACANCFGFVLIFATIFSFSYKSASASTNYAHCGLMFFINLPLSHFIAPSNGSFYMHIKYENCAHNLYA